MDWREEMKSDPNWGQIYSPEMSLREYWNWSKDHNPSWRRNMKTAIIIILVVGIVVAVGYGIHLAWQITFRG